MSSSAASARTSPHAVHLCGPQKLPDEIAAATSAGDRSRLMAIYAGGDATVCADQSSVSWAKRGRNPDQARRTSCSPKGGNPKSLPATPVSW